MRRRAVWVILLTVVLIGLNALAQEDAPSLDPYEILNRVNAAWQGESFHGIIALDIVLGGQTKSHKVEVWTLGDELALVRLLEPEIDRNSGYLQSGDDLWFYSPDVGAINLPSMVIGDALFGAGPSLEDLSRSTLSEEYDVTAEATEAGYFLTLVPRPDAAVVYGKLEISVSADFVMNRLVYFDQRGGVAQTAEFSDVIDIGGRRFPTKTVIVDSYGDRTIQRIEELQFDLELDTTYFSLDTFESWRQDG